MRASIMYIGIIDNANTAYHVEFSEGVNVITGRSSTGKSALIEIFDYCFGSSEFTVPVGVITTAAQFYFTIMKMEASLLVMGRAADSEDVFLKEEFDVENFVSLDWLGMGYFESQYFHPLRQFKKRMNQFFSIKVTDIDEDIEARAAYGKRRSATPSIRSFASFNLQHQNLVANKHAIFYRFDQKEKREQAIEHLKIFLGFADQRYFSLMQLFNELDAKRRRLKREIPKKKDQESIQRAKLEQVIFSYRAITGKEFGLNLDAAISSPANALNWLGAQKVKYVAGSNEHVKLLNQEEDRRTELTSQLRKSQIALTQVESAGEFSKKYLEHNQAIALPRTANIKHANCPFCESENNVVESSANQLTEAIGWLNSELRRSSYRQLALDEELSVLKKQVAHDRANLASCSAKIRSLKKQTENMGALKNQYELAVEAKLRIEAVLKELLNQSKNTIDSDIKALDIEIKKITDELKLNYDLTEKIKEAEGRIRTLLALYGSRFDFEGSYKPINLHFSLESFDLWHVTPNNKEVFLRSMGSGANWLACHLVLFLSLHRYFCEVGADCSIPPILFLDQPSQVYFPTILDNDSEFSPGELVKRDASREKSKPVDEDIEAVTKLFDQLVVFCQETKDETGICPQIIVTDHADKLVLKSGVTFESLVRKRWREQHDGFIDMRGLTIDGR
ncbi:DUF3732 domain-containing protein [Duganella sp. FT80W]|uniref:DUF3732 domain-containing protein n=1 Tax=Duganella guangzhouensis TaxID=2666084 RepID=A0A6I2KS46_9BURK|nr:DUF3732 domain-containing protein [Duganella guangzhouensis]MRW88428.1 DUF3732 domain-containing protein [Duganella guangzhouensis]